MRLVAAALAMLAACGGASRARDKPRDTARRPLAPDHKLYYQFDDVRDRYLCSAPSSAEAACSQIPSGGAVCKLVAPVSYWDGPLHCSGARINDETDPHDDAERIAQVPTPACVCSCEHAYVDALVAYHARLDECSRMP
jgi:hypothetical protein